MDVKKFKVLVVGDIMVDRYVLVTTNRKAQEADIPVWDEYSEEIRLGGAANVAANLSSIGTDDVEVHLAGICSLWKATHLMDNAGIKHERVMGQHTMTKTRYVVVEEDTRQALNSKNIVGRTDNFRKFAEDDVEFFEMMMGYWDQWFDAIIISDYDKGTVTEEIISGLRDNTNLLVVDSKRHDLRLFKGSDVLKVNEHEYGAQLGNRLYHNFVELFDHVVVTKGNQGSDLIMCDRTRSVDNKRIDGGFMGSSYVNHTEEFPVVSKMARDVTGCGDTHTAALTLAYLKTRDIRSAVKFANEVAAQVVQKFGTSVAQL